MQWSDSGIILGSRRHGETSVILEVMTSDHGRHMGIVRGGRSRRLQPDLQPSNHVDLVWRARLDEHLGMFQIEVVHHNAARLFEHAVGVFGFQAAAAHLRLLPERDPHPRLFETLALMLQHFDEPQSAGELFVRFEFQILNELGFGLDLETCAATGASDDLIYVSPKSGRAVSRIAGAPYADRLLPLPAFLKTGSRQRADAEAFDQAMRLAGFFFSRHVWEPRGIREPDERGGFSRALTRHFATIHSEEG